MPTPFFLTSLLLLIAPPLAHGQPAGSTYCAQGGVRRFQGTQSCACTGTVYYCIGSSTSCYQTGVSGSVTCSNGVFGDPSYTSRKNCYCKPSGCSAGLKGPAGSCSACAAGQYQPSNQFTGTSCTNCPSGQYQGSTGRTSCTSCPSGQYQASTGQSGCTNCPTGQSQASTGQTGCTNCGPGTYTNAVGLSACSGCTAGLYQGSYGQTGCVFCPSGSYTNQNSQSGCKNCATGQYKPTASSALCTPCVVGTYSPFVGSSSCANCPRGEYQDQQGKTSCIACPAGKYESRTGSSSASCQGDCTCGYFCAAGSTNADARDCGTGFYCPAGTTGPVPIGTNLGYPIVTNLLLATNFCSQGTCPSTQVCDNGVAADKFGWKFPLACTNDVIYQTTMTEYVSGLDSVNPPEAIGDVFQTEPQSTWRGTGYKIEYSMARIPNGCQSGRADNGQPGTSSWLQMGYQVGSSGTTASADYTAKLKNVDKKANAEDCSSSYAAVVQAVLKDTSNSCAFNGGVCPAIKCRVSVSVSDLNERPSITDSSLTGKTVEEDRSPGYDIGSPIKASDPEVTAGLQQLSWEITECKAESYPAGSGNFVTLSATPGANLGTQCPIKISACDGQLLIAANAALDFEQQVSYRLKVKATDDGGRCVDGTGDTTPCSSSIKTVTVTVIPKNDPPSMVDPQLFYIQENTDINGVWVNYASKNADNTANALCALANNRCGVRANDPDSNVLTFVQATSTDPFVIGPSTVLTNNGADGVSRNFDGLIKFVPNSGIPELDYESIHKRFNLQVYAQDSALARSTGQSTVVVHVLDANDRPVLTGDTCQSNSNQLCIDIIENRAYNINLRINTTDQDIKTAWECCNSSAPYELLTDTTTNSNGCDMAVYTVWMQGGFDGTINMQAGFKILVNTIDYEADPDGCDMIVRIKDKAQLVSHDQHVHITVEDANDNPTNVRLTSACAVDENTAVGETLSGGCIIIADDEDRPAQDLTFHGDSSTTSGPTTGADFTNWQNGKYFGVVTATGNIKVAVMPNYEFATYVTFDATATDSKNGGSAAVSITVTVNDVNEAPVFSDSMNWATMNPTETAGGSSHAFCAKGLEVQEMQTIALSDTVIAYDPDKNTVPAKNGNAQLTFEMQAGYESSDLFTIATTGPTDTTGLTAPAGTYTGTLTPTGAANLNYETMYTHSGLRIGIKVSDNSGGAGALHEDCDMNVALVDINEPPYITDLPDNGVTGQPLGRSTGANGNPLILSTTEVKVGDKVGPTLLIGDPDVGNPNTLNSRGLDDSAVCEKVVDSTTHWDYFEIDNGCQIYVKKLTGTFNGDCGDCGTCSGGTCAIDLSSNGAEYILKIRAKDQGRSFVSTDNVPLYSTAYTYYIRGKQGLKAPVIDNTYRFTINEDVAGTIVQGTHTVNGQSDRTDLYKACTDLNVPGRGNVGTCSNDCAAFTSEDACNGKTPSATTITNCEWVSNDCQCRNQGLRYKIVSTLPRKNSAVINNNMDPFTVNKNSAILQLTEQANYESLFGIDGEIKCTMGQPSPYCTQGTHGICDFWPSYPNGVQGVCRAYNNDRKKANDALDVFGYMDAAHLCAERGARLATLAELKDAYADVSGHFRTPNLLDLWDYPEKYNMTIFDGGGTTNPTKQDGANKEKFPQDTNAMRTWTYSGKVAQITDATGVVEVSTFVDPRTAYPVLCYVGKNFENENILVPTKANKPQLGYSIRMRCLDTAEKTIDEDQLEYYTQSLTDDRFVFVEVADVNEAPYFGTATLDGDITIREDIGRSTHPTCQSSPCLVQDGLNAVDDDKGDARTMRFQLTSTSPFSNTDQADSVVTWRSTSKSTSVFTDLTKIPAQHFDFEVQNSWTFVLTATDSHGLSGTQTITIKIEDVNEPPVFRVPSSPATASPNRGVSAYKTYTLKENSDAGFVLGTVIAYDPDTTTTLSYSLENVVGSENRATDNSPIFTLGQSVLLPDSASFDVYGHITTANLTLSENSAIDFETKQMYTIKMTASDGNLTDTVDIHIQVENVNDLEVTSVVSTNSTLATAGGETVTITGKNFGVKYSGDGGALTAQTPTLTVRYGRLDQDRTSAWFPADCVVNNAGNANTQLDCTSSAGFGADHVWEVSVVTNANGAGVEGDATSDSSHTTSYTTPVITGIAVDSTISAFDATHIPTQGEHLVVLTGTNMGPLNTELQGYYGTGTNLYCAKECKVTVADTQVKCKTIEGIGKDHTWKFERINHNWKGGMSAPSVVTAYETPTITNVAVGSSSGGNVMSTWGNEDMIIVGENFGPAFDPASSCTPSQPGTLIMAWNNMDATTCTQDQHCFAYDQTLSCTVSVAHTQVTCKTLAGVGKGHRFTLTVASQTSALSVANLRYRVPVISGIKGPGAYEANTAGGASFYIEGNYFGPAVLGSVLSANKKYTLDGHAHNSGDGIYFQAQTEAGAMVNVEFKGLDCTVLKDQIYIECKTPVGVGKNLAYQLQVGGQLSVLMKQLKNSFNQRPSYAAPVVSSITLMKKNIAMAEANTRGFTIPNSTNGWKSPETIVITGQNFGPLNTGKCSGGNPNPRPCQLDSDCDTHNGGGVCESLGSGKVTWNPTSGIYQTKDGIDVYTSSLCVVTIAHEQMECDIIEGAGHSHEWTVTVGLQDSRTPTSSYHRPIIDTIIGDNNAATAGKTNGQQIVVLHGMNFGPYPTPAAVTYGVTGQEYVPTGCVVQNHTKLTCTTVPGIGKDLFWQVTVRDQSNLLQATTSYSPPFIHSVTPTAASADGSDERGYIVFLNVSNSGLADPVTRRIVKFDTYEIPAEPDAPEFTHRDGEFDIIAFRVPKLYNRKKAVGLKIELIVFPYDKDTGLAQRSAEIWSSNHVIWEYNAPYISQVTVFDHPTNADQRIVNLIGRNFGNIKNGPLSDEMYKMNVYAVTVTPDQNKTDVISQQLNASIANGPRTTFVQKWEQGAKEGRYDEITVIWVGTSGSLQITRGGEDSNIVHFEDLTPKIKVISYWELEPTRKNLLDLHLPTLGSKTNGEGGTKTIQIDMTCGDCGSRFLKCLPATGTCPNSADTVCDCNDIPETGVPRDVDIWLGSVQLADRHLNKCPIVPGSGRYSTDPQTNKNQWKFTCQVPAYQGSQVDTRIKYNGMWSEPIRSVYRPPVLSFLSRSVGGTKGAVDFSKENYRTTSTQSYLEIPTNGDKIKLTGVDFGKDNHPDITGYNDGKYVSCDGIDYRPTCMDPPHGGLTVDIPAGTGARLRPIQVTTGQFKFDLQLSNTIDVKYYKPTVVNHLVPLWRFDNEGNAGGYEIRILGYDFSTSTNPLNKTTVSFKGTPCEVTFTSYNMIKCTLGYITSTSGNPATVITVDGQSTNVYVAQLRKDQAKDAVAAGQTTRDDELIDERVTYRAVEFKAQINKCVGNTYGADGLNTAMDSTRKLSIPIAPADRTEQQRVVAANATLLNQAEKERVQCIALVQQSFDKKCSDTETEESKAILEAAYKYDETTAGKTPSRDRKCWWEVTIAGPSAVTGPTGGASTVDGYVGRPIITDIYPTMIYVPMRRLPTAGGIQLTVEAYNLDRESTKAVLVDDTGKLPDVWVNDGDTIPESAFTFDGIRWTVQLMLPPGQGKTMRLQLNSFRLGLNSVYSGADELGYAPPEFNATYSTTDILSSPTDSCMRNQYESELLWAARIDGVGKQKRRDNPGIYRRQCLRHFAIHIHGKNFGANTTTVQLWVKGTNMLNNDDDKADDTRESTAPKTIRFPVFNGSLYQTTDPSQRGFAGRSDSFSFSHTHDKLVVMGPEGYGKGCELWLSVAGQEVHVPFDFQPPEADYSEPNPYDANGDSITIHGQNFGGVASSATVIIDGEECKSKDKEHATWFPEHPIKGLPYISCTAATTMAGIANISVFVAGQQSRILQIESISRAGVRSICKASTKEQDLDIKTGQPKEFWGRIEPARELCTPCPEGSGCNDDTYEPPFSLAEFYIQDLDISGGRQALYTTADDPITRRERRDYQSAVDANDGGIKRGRACPPERLLDPVVDATLYQRFEAAVMNKRDFCPSVLPCKPAVACVGKNMCAEKYEGNLIRCKRARSDTPDADPDETPGSPVIQYCNQTLQCQSKSLGDSCVKSITDVCNCPAEWVFGKTYNRLTLEDANLNLPSTSSTSHSKFATEKAWQEYDNDRYATHDCLKACVRDNIKIEQLVEQGCEKSYLEQRLGGYYADYFHPQDSAVCVPTGHCVNETGIKGPSCLADIDCDDGTCEVFGECECQASPRCIECTAGTHYRRDGKCEECPKNMILVFVGFFLGIVIMLLSMFYLDKQDFNLAFISIPIDYFQVLALFSRADIRWPPELLEILYALRFFNFNIDVATPECLLVGLFTYEHKFFGTLLLLPIAVIGLLFCWALHCCWNKIVLHGKPIDKLYHSKLIGTFLLSVYFLFLSCTTRALEVFNCSPTDPDDGWTYTDFTDRKCDGGGLCRCGDPEHLPAQLAPYAVLGLLVYTLGFPLLLFWILRCGGRKNLIKEDQILRAAGVGDSLNTNTRAYYVRVKYHKMYYFFKPGKTYWLLYILTRKAGISTCGLIFRTNPGFMLAGVLLILFVCYMVQVKHQPYMSTSQRALVLAEHKIKAAAGNQLHKGISVSIQKALTGEGNSRDFKRARLAKMTFGDDSIAIGNDTKLFNGKRVRDLDYKEKAQYKAAKLSKKERKKDAKRKAREFFFDYNTVEQVLLACAILVCLAGVMFESDRFQAKDASGKLRYGWMRDFVTYWIITVVIASLFYLVLVTMSEVIGYTPQCLQKLFADKKNHALLSAAATIQDTQDNEIEMNFVNPAASAARVADAKQLEDLQDKLAHQQRVNADLASARRQAKLSTSRQGKGAKSKKGKGKGRKKKKNAFGAKRTQSFDDETVEAPNKMDDNEIVYAAHGTSKSTKKQSLSKTKSWKEVSDAATGKSYYHNVSDNSVSWTKPPEDEMIL